MNEKTRTIVLAVLSIAAIILASTATTMELLPKNTPSTSLPAEHALDTTNIARAASDLPPPVWPGRMTPTNITVTLETKEVYAEIEAGASYWYYTFNGTVPGPFIRVLQNDTVTIQIKNTGTLTHSIDLHAVIGPGGGMVYTQTTPGSTSKFYFKAIHPGLYVYHCATAPVDHHIANGMYGMILVEPMGGLPLVSKEYYIVQGEFYTSGPRGMAGHHMFNTQTIVTENPDYVVFNGRVGSLTGTGQLTAIVGQKVRIFFGVGGPNLASSFHVIGEIFDKVYPQASLNPATALTNVQTTLVSPGGATVVELTAAVTGDFSIVDHSLTRAIEKGAVGILHVNGTSAPGLFGQT